MNKIAMMILLIFLSKFSLAQFIERIYIGRSIDETIQQCKEYGYELVEGTDQVATFSLVNQYGKAKLRMFASPQSNTVWFGTTQFPVKNRKERKQRFNEVTQALTEKYGDPSKQEKREVMWDAGSSYITLEKRKNDIVQMVVSTGAFYRTNAEYEDTSSTYE